MISVSSIREAITLALLRDADYFPYLQTAEEYVGLIQVYSPDADRRIPVGRYTVRPGWEEATSFTLLDGPDSDFTFLAASSSLRSALDRLHIPYIDKRYAENPSDPEAEKIALRQRVEWYADRLRYKAKEL